MLIDLHTHTYPNSDDSFLSIEELIEESKRVGLDGICLTDHDFFWDEESIRKLSNKHDFLILPGCEVTTEEGHLLVYGLSSYVFGMHKADMVKELTDDEGGAMIVAHPYRRRYAQWMEQEEGSYFSLIDRTCQEKVFDLAHGVEVLNGRGSDIENTFSKEVADRLSLRGTGASDAHRVEDIGIFATKFDSQIRDIVDLVRELHAGRFSPVMLKARKTSVVWSDSART